MGIEWRLFFLQSKWLNNNFSRSQVNYPIFVSFTCREQENMSSNQMKTLSVLSLEQCGAPSDREQWPHVARMVLGGRSGGSGGGQTVYDQLFCTETLSVSTVTLVYPVPNDQSPPTYQEAVFPVLCSGYGARDWSLC